jgi:preprotein translocase subunit YajC
MAATNAAAGGGTMDFLASPSGQMLFFLPVMGLLFYLLIWRPQARRQKEHVERIASIKRGETVVLSNGMVGKVTRVEETDAMVEIATGVNVRVVKAMISDIRSRGEPAQADKKS